MCYPKHFLVLLIMSPLVGCDMLGLDTPAKQRAQSEADGKAVGAACRHAGRAIEDCYVLNPTANRAAVFGGWKEMNDYMTKNKIEVVKPQALPTGTTATAGINATPGHTPSAVFEPPARTGTAAKFVPPDSIKKDGVTEKKPPVTPAASSAPPVSTSPAPGAPAPQKSATKNSSVMANIDNATVMRAKEQAHSPGAKPH